MFLMTLILCVVFSLGGCKKESGETTIVKPMEEYSADAAKKIDASNVDAEAAKLIKEVEADAAAEK